LNQFVSFILSVDSFELLNQYIYMYFLYFFSVLALLMLTSRNKYVSK